MKTILTLILTPVMVIVTLVLVRAMGLGLPLQVTTSATGSTELSVVGEGKVTVVPDVAFVDVGVTSDGTTAEEAQAVITKVNNQVVEAMKVFGINKSDIKTQNYNVSPLYDYNSGNKITGYRGNASLSIKVKDALKVGEIAQAATKAGANEIQNTRFVVEKPETYREQARDKAIQNAKEQATKLANQLGIKLGKVVNVVESSDGNIAYPAMSMKLNMSEGMGGGGATANLQPGSQEISSVVTLYFEKK